MTTHMVLPLLPGKRQGESEQATKRLFILITTPLGIISLLTIWGLRQNSLSTSFQWLDNYFLPGIAGFLLILFILYLPRIISSRVFETSAYTITYLYFTFKMFTVIYEAIRNGSEIDPQIFLWVPFVYLLGFIMLDLRDALVGSLVFFIISLLLGAFLIFNNSGTAMTPTNIRLLAEVYLASIFYIFIMYVMARIRENYVSSQVIADLMSRLAMTDSLTQVDNRRRLEQYLLEEINRADRHNQPLSVIMFDIDNFKRVNDRLGHSKGDQVLINTARLVRDSLRSSDHFGRWGGDEFLCITSFTDADTAIHLAERLRQELQESDILESAEMTGSFGITSFARGDTPDTLVRRVDAGMMRAKELGRNQLVYIPPESTLPI